MFGKCKVCLEKDERIKDLLDQVVHLRELANPGKMTVQIPYVHAEADRLLSSVAENSPAETDDAEAIEAEANMLLTGSF